MVHVAQTPAPQIFDRRLLMAHRIRASRQPQIPDFLLERVAEDFEDRLAVIKREFPRVLNLGAATGAVAAILQRSKGVREIVDCESAVQILHRATEAGVVVDEEALPFADETFDLVTSALTLQFVNDLPGTLTQIHRILKPDGLFLGAMVGGETLTELREAALLAESELHNGASPRVAPFADVRDLGGLLQRAGFALPVADSDVVKVTYATPFDLMLEIKAMGASNVLHERRRVPVTRGFLRHLAEIYADRFSEPDGRVRATFEILTMTGWSPHESQQQPLRPGQSAVRLADALGASETRLPTFDRGSDHREDT
ncbi:MAG: methyltransferase domain-containing protein [Hyphomicrobiaceae bacterium]